MDANAPTTCSSPEPWGRYSASGGLYSVNGTDYLYSFGGDTGSDADNKGGLVRTHFRFSLETQCWERLGNSATSIGYRGTATQVEDDQDSVYVLFGADQNRAATNQMFRYSLSNDTWTLLTATSSSSTAIPGPRWKHSAVALDSSRILVTGGRDGGLVRDDAWVLDTTDLAWTRLNTTGLPNVYRHGMALDSTRNVAWIYGGLDESLNRHQSQLWRFDLTSLEVTEVSVNTTNNPRPPRLASHAMEYVEEMDVLMMWGGTCGDDSELHVYDMETNSWCRIFPAHRPDRRDAHLWALQYPKFYVAQGDIICYNRQVLTIADVHVLDLQSLDTWKALYEPTNVPRGTGTEPYCDGSNAGNCQPTPFLEDRSARNSTCSADLLDRFLNSGASTEVPTDLFDTLGPTSAPAPTIATTFSPTISAVATSKSSDQAKPTFAAENTASQAGSNSSPLLWMVLMVVKLLAWR